MKKRRVTAEELKQMESAVFIWRRKLRKTSVESWHLATFTLLQVDPAIVITQPECRLDCQSFEELVLRFRVSHPDEKLFCVTFREKEFAQPWTLNALSPSVEVFEVVA